jgi:hypothetical protein
VLATQASGSLPGGPHVVAGTAYNFTVNYVGAYAAPSGYSAIHFSRYDYFVDARTVATTASGQVRVASRLFKIGPKAE